MGALGLSSSTTAAEEIGEVQQFTEAARPASGLDQLRQIGGAALTVIAVVSVVAAVIWYGYKIDNNVDGLRGDVNRVGATLDAAQRDWIETRTTVQNLERGMSDVQRELRRTNESLSAIRGKRPE